MNMSKSGKLGRFLFALSFITDACHWNGFQVIQSCTMAIHPSLTQMDIHVALETSKTHSSTTKSDPVKSTAADRAEHQKCRCRCWLLCSEIDTAANKAMQDLIVNKWGSASNWSKLQHIVKILSSATARSCSSLERGQLLYANHVQNKSKHHLCMPSAPETATSK